MVQQDDPEQDHDTDDDVEQDHDGMCLRDHSHHVSSSFARTYMCPTVTR